DRGEDERDDHALLARDRLTRQQEDRRQDAEQETGFQDVGHVQKVTNAPRVVKLASNALTGADPADILGRFKRKILQRLRLTRDHGDDDQGVRARGTGPHGHRSEGTGAGVRRPVLAARGVVPSDFGGRRRRARAGPAGGDGAADARAPSARLTRAWPPCAIWRRGCAPDPEHREETLMPLPKRRHSVTRGRKRRTHYKLPPPTRSVCPQCREVKLPHRVCPHCGYYKGREIVATEGS